jgi:hypothetical protein
MSDIYGTGFGSTHDWAYEFTDDFGGESGTRYHCRKCGQVFVHRYNSTPDIFVAMVRSNGVTDDCVPLEPQ